MVGSSFLQDTVNKIVLLVSEPPEEMSPVMKYAVEMAALCGATVELVYVLLLPMPVSDPFWQGFAVRGVEKMWSRLERAATEQLETLKKTFERYHIHMSVKLLKNIGTIELDIARLVVETRCDLIIFPKQHLSHWTEMLGRGSAARLVEELECPALIVA